MANAGEQGGLPVLILSMKGSEQKKRPAVVFLHSTNKCKEWLRPLLEGYASRGYKAVAIDSRYHGERASSLTTYRDEFMHGLLHLRIRAWYAVVVPLIGVQIEATADLGKNDIDKELDEKVWDRIAPGLASQFDSPNTLAPITPRPLLVLNGAEDPRCPLAGLETSFSKASETYEVANCSENFKVIAQPGFGHKMTSEMVKEASDWFHRFLK